MSRAALLAAVTLFCSAAVAEEAKSLPAVDALFADYDHADTPGCALGVIQDGEFIYRQGYGMANLEYDIPITSSSVFRIASTSKQFTGMAVALLAESGEISLQDPLSRFFPEFADWAEQVTVRQLLEHSSGVRDYLTLAWLVGLTEYTDHYTLEWVLELLARQQETNFEPGSEFLYSNSGYMLLAQIVERVTGQTLREFSEENIFGPLGMTHSRFQDNHAHIVRNRADGYEPSDTGFDVNMTTLNLVGDGAVFTSIDDLLFWDRNFYDNQLGKGDKDLIERAPDYDGDFYYSFGLEWDEYRGLSRVSHSGSFAGFRADLMRFPEQQFSVAVLCNRDDAAPTSLANRVADYYLQDAMQAIDTDESVGDVAESGYPISVFAGDYWDSTHMTSMRIEVEGDALWSDHPEIGRYELGRIGALRWQLLDSPWEVTFDFEVEDGSLTGVETEYFKASWGSFVPFERVTVDTAELAAYVGNYYSPELDIEYQLAVNDGQFTFDLKGEHPQELAPLFDGMFENLNWGVFEFQKNDSGDVTRISIALRTGQKPCLHQEHSMNLSRRFGQLVAIAVLAGSMLVACSRPTSYDLILRGGTIVDGSGESAYVGDVAINGDAIAALGDLGDAVSKNEIDVAGLAVAPGFTNMLSWSNESLIEDGRSQSEIRQGVTLQVFGEGNSMGPRNDEGKAVLLAEQTNVRYDIEWNTLGEYLDYLVVRGVSTNVASYIGAANPREYVIGYDDREPTPEELDEMRALVRQAMEEGAMGVASSLIYPPGSFAKTDELIELSKVAAEYDGVYASHIRNEGSALLEAIDELITIAREADIRAELYHYKVAGQANWDKFDESVAMIEAARAEGLEITADVYTYPAGATGLNASIPPWVQEGGFEASVRRMQDPAIRKKLAQEMITESEEWDNAYLEAGSPDRILLVSFKSEALKPLTGKTLAEVAEMRGTSPQETAMDLIIEDNSRVGTIYFTQSEDIVRKVSMLPWVSFNSDEASQAPEGVFLNSNPHPRAYGSFARVLAQYVREDQVITLEDAVRKLAALPAEVLKLDRRGTLTVGNFADVVVFDPATIQDHATFAEPHQYATGVTHVFVNGTQVIKDSEHTGATPGVAVRGPGWVQP